MALENFEGSVIFVTHDREFISSLANKVISIKDGKLDFFDGTYDEYVA
jgi:ATPase subunit of ABC transporter with duplicated ATPase domains